MPSPLDTPIATRVCRILAGGLALLATAGPARAADVPASQLTVGEISGSPGDRLGSEVVNGGDVNGDGRDDVILGAPTARRGSCPESGRVYVLFGSDVPASTSVAATASRRGLSIEGSCGDFAGRAIAGGADVNGDGLDDVLIGAPAHNGPHGRGAGAAYVVFGRRSPARIDLDRLGSAGFRIDGARGATTASQPYDAAGSAVALIGSPQGGKARIAVGAPRGTDESLRGRGHVWVLAGRTSNTPVDLANPPRGTLRLDGAANADGTGESLASGDLDGNGTVDLLVGAPDDPRAIAAHGGTIFGLTRFSARTTLALATQAPIVLHGPPGSHLGLSLTAVRLAAGPRILATTARALPGSLGGATYVAAVPSAGRPTTLRAAQALFGAPGDALTSSLAVDDSQLLITAPGARPGGAIYLAPPTPGTLTGETRIVSPANRAFAGGLSTNYTSAPYAPAAVLHGYLGPSSSVLFAVGDTRSSSGGTHSGAIRLLTTPNRPLP